MMITSYIIMIALYMNDDDCHDFHPDDDVDNGCITKRIYCKSNENSSSNLDQYSMILTVFNAIQ